MEVIVATWLVPVLVVVAGGLLIRGQGPVRGMRYWVGIALMLTGPIAFLVMQFDILLNLLLMPRHASWYQWWSALFLALLIALVAVLAIGSLRSRPWLVWPVVGSVLLLPVAPVIALFILVGIASSVPSNLYTPDLAGPIEDIREVAENDLANDVVVGDRTIRITPDEPPRPLGSGGLAEDTLFLYGGQGDDAWYLVLGRADTGELAGCYTLSTLRVFDDGSHLIFVIDINEGLRLPKGATLNLPPPDPDTGLYPFPGHSYCIEEDGTVSDSELP